MKRELRDNSTNCNIWIFPRFLIRTSQFKNNLRQLGKFEHKLDTWSYCLNSMTDADRTKLVRHEPLIKFSLAVLTLQNVQSPGKLV